MKPFLFVTATKGISVVHLVTVGLYDVLIHQGVHAEVRIHHKNDINVVTWSSRLKRKSNRASTVP